MLDPKDNDGLYEDLLHAAASGRFAVTITATSPDGRTVTFDVPSACCEVTTLKPELVELPGSALRHLASRPSVTLFRVVTASSYTATDCDLKPEACDGRGRHA